MKSRMPNLSKIMKSRMPNLSKIMKSRMPNLSKIMKTRVPYLFVKEHSTHLAFPMNSFTFFTPE